MRKLFNYNIGRFIIILFLGGLTLSVSSCYEKPCDPNLCENGGKIRRDGDSCFCKCPEDVYGRFCDEVDECIYLDCKNGGECIDGKCNCPEGYTGIDCSIEEDPCKLISCANGGICIDGSCSCPDGFYGEFCENSLISKMAGSYKMVERCKKSGTISYNTKIVGSKRDALVAYIPDIGQLDAGNIRIKFGSKGILIPKQALGYLGVFIYGSGQIDSFGNITGQFTYYDYAFEKEDPCTFRMTKIK